MTSYWSVLEFIKNLFWLMKNRPNYTETIAMMIDVVDHAFVCYNYDKILESVKHDKEAYERLLKSNICVNPH
ncbi:hypothetical protein SBFV2_gp43 [Sulfolobales Beppu filamentous virus 2]|uniref:Uncharacterized protein n=1 Tax=Sulfolobales Beppu filamentous virus 2 TaxID=2493123 RepID=A0A3Q8Q729_9VIRU|nr:hypothetical protein HOU84_gp43 [Sulfolobales Beppu filamentous virus 2]AZI75810.1 hypothetical protein SBFV2_gp43 [Sulfolobales Beppu filamentous virus 2]